MQITYVDKGQENNFKRIDTVRTIHATHYFLPEDCSLLYVYLNEFNLITIPLEDIVEIKE